MKNKLKKILAVILVVTFAMANVSCGEEKRSGDKPLRVGVVLYTENDAFINALTETLRKDFEKLETDGQRIIMTVRNGADSQDTQDNVVSEMIDAGCDILCIDLVDRTAPTKIIEMAKKNDIPVIFFNREPVKEDIMRWSKLYYVGGDAEQSGILQGQIAADQIEGSFDASTTEAAVGRLSQPVDKNGDGKIQYVVMEGEMGHQDAIMRTDKAVSTLNERGIKLDKVSYQIADWNRTQAENKMTQLISQHHSDIELVFSNNDEMALGIIQAYQKSGIRKDAWPLIYGIDGLPDGINAVKRGYLQGTVYNDKEGQAEQISKLTMALSKGESLSEFNFVNERYIILPYERVDESNVEEYLNR